MGQTWWLCVICAKEHQPEKNAPEIDFMVCSKECKRLYIDLLATRAQEDD